MKTLDQYTPWSCCFVSGLTLLTLVVCHSSTYGEIIAGWNFNDLAPEDHVHSSYVGDGVLTLDDRSAAWSALQGTSLNAWDEWPSGSSLGIRGSASNGATLTIQHPIQTVFSSELTFAMRRSVTGFQEVHLDYLTEAGWIKLGSALLESEWSIARFRIPGAIGTLDYVSLRMTIEGATSSQGTARFDNMLLHTIDIPTPGALGVLFWGLRYTRRRPHVLE